MGVIKGIFFDWVGTLVHPEPDRHESIHALARELGYELPLDVLKKSLYRAEDRVSEGAPGLWREGKDDMPFLRWWDVCLDGVAVEVPPKVRMEITRRARQRVSEARWVLYDDVLPVVRLLKGKGLLLGLISNLCFGRSIIEPYVDVIVTAQDAGAAKPDPSIFLQALRKGNVEASQATYIGDQYTTDVLGARAVGMKAILVDRHEIADRDTDCTIVYTLSDIPGHLD